MMFIKNNRTKGHFKRFIDAYKDAAVRFEDMNIKNITYEVIKLTMNS